MDKNLFPLDFRRSIICTYPQCNNIVQNTSYSVTNSQFCCSFEHYFLTLEDRSIYLPNCIVCSAIISKDVPITSKVYFKLFKICEKCSDRCSSCKEKSIISPCFRCLEMGIRNSLCIICKENHTKIHPIVKCNYCERQGAFPSFMKGFCSQKCMYIDKYGKSINRQSNSDKLTEKVKEISNNKNGDADKDECTICMEKQKTHIFTPCGHKATCKECGDNFKDKQCPICREIVKDCIQVFQI